MAHIVVGTDLTEASRPAFDAAVALARDLSLGVILVHATRFNTYVAINGGPPAKDVKQAREEHSMDLALRLSEEWLAIARQEGLDAEGHIKPGEAADLIIEAAADAQAPFIVVGSHHRKGLARFILGSVAEAVVRRSKVPVLVVPTHH